MIRTSAPFASWILQRQLTEMKEAAVTAMRHVGELADLVRFSGIFRFHHIPRKKAHLEGTRDGAFRRI